MATWIVCSMHNQDSKMDARGRESEREEKEHQTKMFIISSLPSLLLMMVSSVCLYMNE